MFVEVLVFCREVSGEYKEWSLIDRFNNDFREQTSLRDRNGSKARYRKLFTLALYITGVTERSPRVLFLDSRTVFECFIVNSSSSLA